jgi:hypothetical protein
MRTLSNTVIVSALGRKRLSPVMRLVESDRLRVAADRRARQAEQDKGRTPKRPLRLLGLRLNNPARAITEARERARAVEAQAARKDIERAAVRQAFIS